MSTMLDMPLEAAIEARSPSSGRGRRGRGRRGARGGLSRARAERRAAEVSVPNNRRRGRGRGGRTAGAGGAGAGSERRSLKAGAETNAKSIAGSIAHVCREGDAPLVTAIGSLSMNQALKGVIIARDYLRDEGMDLTVQPRVMSSVGPDAIEFSVAKTAVARPVAAGVALKVAGSSDSSKVAGAVAANVREGSRVSITGIGPDAVKNIVKTVTTARTYLKDDAIDLTMRPEFTEVMLEGARSETSTAVTVHVLAIQL